MKRILLIDDEKGFTNVLKHSLEETGAYQVDVVNDPRKALDRVREERPDLIILDIVMPHLDGGDIVNLLDSDPDLCAIPVLVLTAMIRPETTGAGMVQAANFSMLAKPVEIDTLIQSIEIKLSTADDQ